MLKLALPFATLLLISLPASAAELWTTDLAAAKTQAASEHKDLLLEFTGSDWCAACVMLKKEVFDTEKFQQEAPSHFVLVELDYPRARPQPAAVRKQNKELQKQFAIEIYPTLYLADEKGRPYARIGYQAGGPEKFLLALEKLRTQKTERDNLLQKADRATGLDRAKFLDQALSTLIEKDVRVGYDELMLEITSLDRDNTAGLKKKYEVLKKLNDTFAAINGEDGSALLHSTDELLAENSPVLTASNKQELWFLKAQLLSAKKDTAGAIAAYKAARDALPGSDKAGLIEIFLANLQEK
jgi:thioredoxin-related protein